MTKISKKIGKMWKDTTGVSPIIAVILMVAITVVLAATIYVWVSGFGGGSGSNIALTLKQDSHGWYNSSGGGNYSGTWTTAPIINTTTSNAGIVMFTVQAVNGNPGYENLQFKINGNIANVEDGQGNTMSGAVNSGDKICVYYNDNTIYTGEDSIVGQTLTITDLNSGSVIYSASITYA